MTFIPDETELVKVVRFAEHLAIIDGGVTPFAPRRNVVCIHILQIPYLAVVGIVAYST